MITKEDFCDEFAELADQAGITETCAVEFIDSPGDPHDLHFYFSPGILRLPEYQRRELIMRALRSGNPAPDVVENFLAVVGSTPARVEAAETVVSSYEQGEIRNVVYKDAKDILGRAFEDAWLKIRNEYTAGRGGNNPESTLAWDFSISSLHDAIASKKKLDLIKKSSGADPRMIQSMARLFDTAYPLAIMVKELKSKVVKGKVQLPPQPVVIDPRRKTCAACFGEFVVTAGNRPKRHGFSIITRGRGQGHLGAWHTGPCIGSDYPHYGLSSEGTKAVLEMARKRLKAVEGFIKNLENRPPLQWAQHVHGEKTKFFTIVPGESADYRTGSPSYESLFKSKMAEHVGERASLLAAIDLYKEKIATWRPR
jgi:hypothetical protein